MTEREMLQDLKLRMERNLQTGILPFWREYLTDSVHGGFYGRVDGSWQNVLTIIFAVIFGMNVIKGFIGW